MSRFHRFLGGLGFAYLNQASIMLVGLWLTPFLLRHIGAHNFGLWLAGTQLLAYLLLMDLGVLALLPREIAYCTGSSGAVRAPELARVVGESARIILLQLPLVALGALLVWLTLPVAWDPLRRPLCFIFTTFVLFFPLRILTATLEGLQELAFLGRMQFAAWAVNVIATVLLVSYGWGLEALAVGWALAQTVLALGSFLRLRERYPGVLPAAFSFAPGRQVFSHLRRGLWLSAALTAQSLLSGTDLLLVTLALGPSAGVVYACTGKLVNALANQPQALMNASAPAVSELRAAGDRARLLMVSVCLTRAMMTVSGLVACVVITANQHFVGRWVGADKFGGVWLTGALVATMLLRHLNSTALIPLISFGLEKRVSLTTLSDGLVSLFGALAALHFFGLPGAAIGSLMGAVFVSLPLNFRALGREAGVSGGAILASLLPWFWRFLVMAGIAQYLRRQPALATWPGLFAAVLGISLLYILIVAPLFFREPLAQYTLPLLRRLRRFSLKSAALEHR